MPEVRTFQGADLPSVLAEVAAELGDDARVLSADKLRSGGVGGFFAREVYSVVATVPAPAGPDPAPTNLLELADATSRRERLDGRCAAPATVAPAEPDDDGDADGAAVFSALLAGLSAPPPAAPVRDDRHDEALGSLFRRAVAVGEPADPAPVASARVQPAFTDLPRLRRSGDGVGVEPVGTEPPVAAPAAPAEAPAPAVVAPVAPAAPAVEPSGSGVDPAVVFARIDEVADVAVTADTRGVVVVVGPAAQARRAAAQLATEVAGGATGVLVAAPPGRVDGVAPWKRLSGVADVDARRPHWAGRAVPVVVALCHEADDAEAWMAGMLHALQPVAVHDATGHPS